jgi:hypothetical protein
VKGLGCFFSSGRVSAFRRTTSTSTAGRALRRFEKVTYDGFRNLLWVGQARCADVNNLFGNNVRNGIVAVN